MSEAIKKTKQTPESYSPKVKPEIIKMTENMLLPIEKLVEVISYRGITFEVVERPDVLWVGCLDYTNNNDDESDSSATLNRYQEYLDVVKQDLMNPDWSASLWVNYGCDDKPHGQMFAQETYSANQDKRYETFLQPGGLWLRVRRKKETSLLLFGGESIDAWDYFGSGIMQNAAEENGYKINPDIHVRIGYDCHAEYGTPPHTCYAYVPVIKDLESYSPKNKPEILNMMEENATNIFPENFMLEKAAQDGEPHLGSRCPELQPFTTSIRALLDYTGQNFGYIDNGGWRLDVGFTLVCNLSGEAYVDDRHMCDGNDTVADYQGYRNMFRQLGFENYEQVYTRDISKADLQKRIMETLVNEKTPVIIDNLAECPIGCAVVGYENNGETFVGWNYHVFDFSPNPKPQIFKKENWYEEAAYVAFVGKRVRTPELKALYRQGILMAFNTLTGDGVTMKNAKYYEDWKRYFNQTEDECIEEVKRTHYIIGYGTPPESLFEDDKKIRQELIRTIDPAWCAYSERRYYAEKFMRQAKKHFPAQANVLDEIACCFDRTSSEHMENFINKVGREPIDRDKLRSPIVRSEMAEIIDKCKAEEKKAIVLLNQIIKAI